MRTLDQLSAEETVERVMALTNWMVLSATAETTEHYLRAEHKVELLSRRCDDRMIAQAERRAAERVDRINRGEW